MDKPLILITNDDGIDSPGLVALAAALDPLGDLLIVAPQFQQSGAGRSMHSHYSGRILETTVSLNGKTWHAYAADASPALSVQHGYYELAPRVPSLVVSGINFGENIGLSAGTISGTVGAALEGAAKGVPSIAVSLEVDPALHLDFDDSVDFSVAMHFARVFAEKLLAVERPDDVDVLKVDIPKQATVDSTWRVTRLEKRPYYMTTPPQRENGLQSEGKMGYQLNPDRHTSPDTDAGAMVEGVVSVTPLSLDMTSRVDLSMLESLLDD
ncbi:MAG: 5'/3'-nucleotidase SurE [Chloroflexi bacterium]|nr:5'/3'-nucleotidase SurE [Chloroflexota bacterium]